MATVLLSSVSPGVYPNYEALKAGILSFAQREDLDTYVASFIELAERSMFRELALRATETTLTGATAGETISIPAVLNAIERIEIVADGVRYTLNYTTPNGIETLTVSTDRPSRYTVENGAIRMIPAPGGAYSYTVFYLQTPDMLSPGNQTNAILAAYPDLYLWGGLTELARFIQDQDLEASYLNAYKLALSSIQRADERRRFPVSGGLQVKVRGAR